MEEKKNQNYGGNVTTGGLLQVALIVLKLCGVIKWSWALVLLPLWISLGLTVILLVLIFAVIRKGTR